MSAKGLIHVYTGEGKGKSTAAFGLVIRALGHKKKVAIFSFLKDSKTKYGEMEAFARLFPELIYIRFENASPLFDKNVTMEGLKKSVDESFEKALEIIKEKNIELAVFDELNICMKYGYIDNNKVLDFLKNKPEELEVVITGRDAVEELINIADYVTEMRMIKHPYNRGIKARKGIEF
ncbi:MAG: cob(I)yrinic acid a,c-diamide adenosyltransferase [Proteobacteria bacterium]|nr:cob(I)yrinic acid a,c-diamide adenosyltransferase [Pseudomonadota bacterium]